ncbi:MAG: hypothetical protein J2P37_34525, partial [Ktedonobacteraceae bacterium]|nr:hypothetical protein [Ktedonobacteraceae bacterium]
MAEPAPCPRNVFPGTDDVNGVRGSVRRREGLCPHVDASGQPIVAACQEQDHLLPNDGGSASLPARPLAGSRRLGTTSSLARKRFPAAP